MAVDAGWTRDVRARAAAELGLDAGAVLIAATHTHSAQGQLFAYDGPVGPALRALLEESEGPCDDGLRTALADGVIACLRKALAQLRPARARAGWTDVAGIGSNRLVPGGPVDPRCLYVAFDALDDEPIAAIVHYACHPTVLAATDLVVSPDFPGVAIRRLDALLGGVHLFLNGALGDVSTRDTRRVQTRDEVGRFGRLLAEFATAANTRTIELEVDLAATSAVLELLPNRNGGERLD